MKEEIKVEIILDEPTLLRKKVKEARKATIYFELESSLRKAKKR